MHNGACFPKTSFTLDFNQGIIRCPSRVSIPFAVGKTVHFPQGQCAVCPLRGHCTTSAHGRSVAIHPHERLLVELRERQDTKAGRATLRERTAANTP